MAQNTDIPTTTSPTLEKQGADLVELIAALNRVKLTSSNSDVPTRYIGDAGSFLNICCACRQTERPWAMRVLPSSPLRIVKSVSKASYKKLAIGSRPMAWSSVSGTASIEIYQDVVFDGATIVRARGIYVTPVASIFSLEPYLVEGHGAYLVLDVLTAGCCKAAGAFPLWGGIVPNIEVTSSLALFESALIEGEPQGLAEIAAIVGVTGVSVGAFLIGAPVAATGAVAFIAATSMLCNRRDVGYRMIAKAVAGTKPSDILVPYLPEFMIQHRLNPVHVSLFVNEVFLTVHGHLSIGMLSLRAAEVFGVIGSVVIVIVDVIIKFVMNVINRRALAANVEGEAQGLVSSIAGAVGIVPSASVIRSLAKDLHTSVLAVKDLSTVLAAVLDWLPMCVRRFIAWMLPERSWFVMLSDLEPDKLLAKADVILSHANIMRLVNSGQGREAFDELSISIMEMRRRVDGLVVPPMLGRHLEDVVKKIDATAVAIDSAEKARAGRMTPFCISLVGASGVGKSTLANELAVMFGRYDGDVCPRVHGSPYWDGYTGQRTIIIDDFACINKPDYFAEFLLLVSNAPFLPPLASMDNASIGIKGTPCTSQVIITTSNVMYPHCSDMPTVEAIHRRRHLLVRVEQPILLPQADGKTFKVNENVPRFQRMQPLENKPIGNMMTRAELIELIEELQVNHFTTENQLLLKRENETYRFTLPPGRAQGLPKNFPVAVPAECLPTAERFAAAMQKPEAVFIAPEACKLPLSQPVGKMLKAEVNVFTNFVKTRPIVSACIAIGGVGAAAYVAYRATRPSCEVGPQGANPYEPGSSGRSLVVRRRPVVLANQGEGEDSVFAGVVGRIVGSTPGRHYAMHCIHTQGVLIVPSHFMYYFDEDVSVTFTKFAADNTSKDYIFVARQQDAFHIADTVAGERIDLCAIPLPRHVPSGRSLESFMLNDVRSDRVTARLFSRTAEKHTLLIKETTATRAVDRAAYGNGVMRFELDSTWRYPLQTAKGDCGALLVATISNRSVIVGLHTAYLSNQLACATSIDLDAYRLLVSASAVTNSVTGEQQGLDVPKELRSSIFNFLSKGELVNHVAKHTAIRRSLAYECLGPCTTDVSVLTPQDPRICEEVRGVSPLFKAVSKFGNPGQGYDPVALEMAIGYAKSKFCVHRGIPAKVLSLDVAVAGDSQLGIGPLDMTTSSGWPWKRCGPKRIFFEFDGQHYSPKQLVRDAVAERLAAAQRGHRVSTIWVDLLKDERRAFEKIALAKTRQITMPPLDYTLLFRMFFLSFIETFYTLFNEGPTAVGMDPESSDMNTLALRLQHHPLFFDGDISNNDGAFPPELMWSVFDVVQEFYANEDRTVRAVLIDDLLYSVQLAGDLLYQKQGGNPSGNPGTTCFNTIGNVIQFAYMWYRTAPEPLLNSFEQCVELAVYGDDNVGSVSKSASSFYNPEMFEREFALCGRAWTTALKTKDTTLHTSLEKVTFLKRSFSRSLYPTLWVGLLPLDVVREMSYFVRVSDDPIQACLDNMNTALMFAGMRGVDLFLQYRQAFATVMRDYAMDDQLKHYEQVRNFLWQKHHRGAILGVAQGNSVSSYSTNNFNQQSGGNMTMPIEQGGDAFDQTNKVTPTLSTAVGLEGSSPNASITPAVDKTETNTVKQVSPSVGASTVARRNVLGVEGAASHARAERHEGRYTGQYGTPARGPNSNTGAMDLVAQTLDPPLLWSFSRPNMSNACNVEPVLEMRTYAGAESICAEHDFEIDLDEMRLDYLVRKPGWFQTVVINSAATPGSVVAAFPVTPCLPLRTVNNVAYGTTGASMPFCTLFGLYTEWWTGDIELTFLFGSGAFTTGKVIFCVSFEYEGFPFNTNAPITLADVANQYTVVYDLSSQDKRLTLRIPWMQPFLAGHTLWGNLNPTVWPTAIPAPWANGILQMFVLNQISTNTGSPANVEVEVFIAGGPNLQFSGLSTPNAGALADDQIYRNFFGVPTLADPFRNPIPTITGHAQGGESITQNIVAGGADSQPTQDHLEMRTLQFPDVRWNMQNVVERMTYVSTASWNTGQAPGTALYAKNVPSGVLGSTLLLMPFQNFIWWRGAVRIKIDIAATKYHTGKLIMGFSYYPPNDYDQLYAGTHAVIDATGASSTVLDHPFSSVQEAVNSLGVMTNFYLVVLQQLQAATGVDNTVSIALSVSFPKSQFFVPRIAPSAFAALRHAVDDTDQPISVIAGAPMPTMEEVTFAPGPHTGSISSTSTQSTTTSSGRGVIVDLPDPPHRNSDSDGNLAWQRVRIKREVVAGHPQGDDELTTSSCSTSAVNWSREAIVMVESQRIFPLSQISGERVASFRDMLKRRWVVSPAVLVTTSPIVVPVAGVFSFCPYLPLLSAFFKMRGSLRLTFEYRQEASSLSGSIALVFGHTAGDVTQGYGPAGTIEASWIAASGAGVLPTAFAVGDTHGGSAAFSTVICQANRCVTVEIPFSWLYRTFNPGQLQPAAAGTNSENPWGFMSLTCDQAAGNYIAIYAGIADDFRMGRVYRNPFVKLLRNGGPNTHPYWA